MICNVRDAGCPRSSRDKASAQQEVASLDGLNRFESNVACGISAGLWRSLHRYVFQLVMTSVHRKMFNECVPHPLVGRGLYDKRETPRIMGIFPLPALARTLCSDLRKNLKHTTLIQVYVPVFMCCQIKSVVFHDFTQSKPSICLSTQRFILEEAGPLVKTIAMRMR